MGYHFYTFLSSSNMASFSIWNKFKIDYLMLLSQHLSFLMGSVSPHPLYGLVWFIFGCPRKPHTIRTWLSLVLVISLLSGTGIGDVTAAPAQGLEPAHGGGGGRRRVFLLLLCSILLFAVAMNDCPAMPPCFLEPAEYGLKPHNCNKQTFPCFSLGIRYFVLTMREN